MSTFDADAVYVHSPYTFGGMVPAAKRPEPVLNGLAAPTLSNPYQPSVPVAALPPQQEELKQRISMHFAAIREEMQKTAAAILAAKQQQKQNPMVPAPLNVPSYTQPGAPFSLVPSFPLQPPVLPPAFVPIITTSPPPPPPPPCCPPVTAQQASVPTPPLALFHRNPQMFSDLLHLAEKYPQPATPTPALSPSMEFSAHLDPRASMARGWMMPNSPTQESGGSLSCARSATPPSSTDSDCAEESPSSMLSPNQSAIAAAPSVASLAGTRCGHNAHWKRLRAKKGFSHYLCQLCGAKWRKPKLRALLAMNNNQQHQHNSNCCDDDEEDDE